VTVNTASSTGADGGIADSVFKDMMDVSGGLNASLTSGQITWTFDSDATTFDYLAAGETLVLDFSVDAGSNDSAAEDLEEVAATTAGAASLMTAGTLTLTDADATDTHVISEVLASASYEDGSGNVVSATLPAGLMATLMNATTFTATNTNSNDQIDWTFDLADADVDFLAAGEELIVVYNITADDQEGFDGTNGTDENSVSAPQTVDTNGVAMTAVGAFALVVDDAADTVTWTFDVSDAAIDYLAANETITQTYTVQVSDGNGGTVDQVVTITITGTNDAPTIDAVDAVTVNGASTGTDGGISNADLLAMMAVAGDLDATETSDQITWSFDSNATTFDYLAAGETLVLDCD